MKTLRLKMLFVLLAGVMIASCIHEFSEENKPPEMSLTVQEARAAFERGADILEISPLTTNPNTRSLDDDIVITPLWDKAVNFSNANGAYVVVPFNMPLGHIFARKQLNMEVPEDEKFNNTDIRLLIEKKQKNEYLYSIIYLTGNYSYIKEKNGDIASLRLDNLDSFSGSIRHYSLQGEMLRGDIYHHGRIVGSISAIDKPSQAELDSLKLNSTTAQTRIYVTRCEPHLMEYEICYHTGYPTAEGIVETHVECNIEYRWENYCYEIWIEDGTDNYRCPLCGNPNCGGYCQPTPPDSGGGGTTQSALSQKAQNIKQKLDVTFAGVLGNIKKVVRMKEGTTTSGKLAEGIPDKATMNEMLYSNVPINMTFSSSLTDLQLMLVMTHEYTHFELLEKSRTAGSRNQFTLKEPELSSDINNSNEATSWGKVNDDHHEYMGSHIGEMESRLRSTFPGQSEDFYKYGKWGGGATDSKTFGELPKKEQRKIKNYLKRNGL